MMKKCLGVRKASTSRVTRHEPTSSFRLGFRFPKFVGSLVGPPSILKARVINKNNPNPVDALYTIRDTCNLIFLYWFASWFVLRRSSENSESRNWTLAPKPSIKTWPGNLRSINAPSRFDKTIFLRNYCILLRKERTVITIQFFVVRRLHPYNWRPTEM